MAKIVLLILSFFIFTFNSIDLNINEDEDFFAILEIPQINLKERIYNIDSPKNNVDKNLMVVSLKPLIIAGHSGVGVSALFNDLSRLKINDKINIYYFNNKVEFSIYDIYDIEKTGKLYLYKEEIDIVVLVTCKFGTNKQTIYKARKVE